MTKEIKTPWGRIIPEVSLLPIYYLFFIYCFVYILPYGKFFIGVSWYEMDVLSLCWSRVRCLFRYGFPWNFGYCVWKFLRMPRVFSSTKISSDGVIQNENPLRRTMSPCCLIGSYLANLTTVSYEFGRSHRTDLMSLPHVCFASRCTIQSHNAEPIMELIENISVAEDNRLRSNFILFFLCLM